MAKEPTLDDLRRYAVARTLFKPTTLARAIDKLGFVQADPIRAPARAQDLTLRHRVLDYCAGELAARLRSIAEETQYWTPEEYGKLPHVNVTPQTVRLWIRSAQLSAQSGPKGYLIPKGAERTQRAG